MIYRRHFTEHTSVPHAENELRQIPNVVGLEELRILIYRLVYSYRTGLQLEQQGSKISACSPVGRAEFVIFTFPPNRLFKLHCDTV